MEFIIKIIILHLQNLGLVVKNLIHYLFLYINLLSNGQHRDSRQAIEIAGFTIGLGQRLKYPDDYFTIYNGVNFQQYELINSQSFLSFSNGFPII